MRGYFIFLLLLGSQLVKGQSLAEIERQLDSLLRKEAKSEVIISVGYGNNPAYGSKTVNLELPVVLKPFVSPSLSYYHKSGFYGAASAYYLFNTRKPWFQWDATAGYDYTKNRRFITGISYTRYFFADSSDVPETPIKNEIFAYFHYRKWWIEPAISLDFGWGKRESENRFAKQSLSGRDFNVITTIKHPFIFTGLMKSDDALLIIPSLGFTMGTANYYSSMRSFQYLSRSGKIKKARKKKQQQLLELEDRSGFEPRALDLTIGVSYIMGKLTLSPTYTLFKPLQGSDTNLMNYFTARLSFTF